MSSLSKQVFVISDIHLGGDPPTAEDRSGRGFRMCTQGGELAAFIERLAVRPAQPTTELVINGDFVDFLAEKDKAGWAAFTIDPEEAVAKFQHIAKNEAAVFRALATFLRNGHTLTILIGNHDLELSLPSVREALSRLLGLTGTERFRYIYDNEAYVIGDVLIEHGNRYDGFNVVNHDALRELRSLQSRRQGLPEAEKFPAPTGSLLVSRIMNAIKTDYPFVDLLKPETEAAVPILLALNPAAREKLLEILKYKLQAQRDTGKDATPAKPVFRSSDLTKTPTETDASAELRKVLESVMPDAGAFLSTLSPPPAPTVRGPVMRGGSLQPTAAEPQGMDTLDWKLSVAQLLAMSEKSPLERRLPPLLKALRTLRRDRSFTVEVETDKAYIDAARALAAPPRGFRYVVFGHTHLAKRISLGSDAQGRERVYLNSGTWADLIQLPDELFQADEQKALAYLRSFVTTLNQPSDWLIFEPTCVRIDFAGDVVTRADIYDPRTEEAFQ